MKKSQAMEIIIKVVEENRAKVNENIMAEYDFLLEEYENNPKNVTAEDLQSLMSKLVKEGFVKTKEATPKAENSTTKGKATKTTKATKEAKKEEKVAEPKKADEPKKEGNEENMIKANTKKGTAKNSTQKETKGTTAKKGTAKKKAENSTKKVTAPKLVKMTNVEEEYEFKGFPKTLKTELGTLKLATDIKTMKDLANVSEDREIVIANAWVVDMLKTYDYDPMGVMDEEETENLEADGFENDLDLLQINFCTEKVAYAVSLYTEVHTTYTPNGFEVDENGLRNNGFVNYQIYEIVK